MKLRWAVFFLAPLCLSTGTALAQTGSAADAATIQLEQLRDQIGWSAEESAQLTAHIKDAERRVSQEQDTRQRQQMEDEIKRAKTLLEQIPARDRQQQDRESQLAGVLQNEQAKLNDFNARLDAVERLLRAPPPK